MKKIIMLAMLACLTGLSAPLSSTAEEVEAEQIQRCIRTSSIRRTDVIDDRTILFYMRGKTIYLNILPRNCRGLSYDGRFSYSSSVGRLCSADSVQILTNSGGELRQGRSCRLGDFHPISKEDIPAMIDKLQKPPEPVPPAPPKPIDITKETDS